MATQTDYVEGLPVPSAGTIAGSRHDVIHGICETVAGIGFGLAVSQGTESDAGAILGGTIADFKGVSVKDVTLPQGDKYLPPNTMAIMAKGIMWVLAKAAVEANDPVHFDAATGEFSNTGGQGPIPGAYWVKGAANGARGQIYIAPVRKNGISAT